MKKKYLGNDRLLKTPIKLIGAKSRIRKGLYEFKPKDYSTYIEPFAGSLTMLFGKDKDEIEIINDYQWQIINLFQQIQNYPEEMWTPLNNGIEQIKKAGKQYFFTIRDNSYYYSIGMRDTYNKYYLIDCAVRFYLLNKSCFNGIYREDKNGRCNSSFCGDTINRGWLDYEWYEKVVERLKDVKLYNKDFREIIPLADENTWLFIDAPYLERQLPEVPDGTVTRYNGKKFTLQDHLDLRDLLANSKGKWLKTINDCKWIREQYKDFNIKENFVLYSCSNSGTKGRGEHPELIITNY